MIKIKKVAKIFNKSYEESSHPKAKQNYADSKKVYVRYLDFLNIEVKT